MTTNPQEIADELDKSLLSQLKKGQKVVTKEGEVDTIDPSPQLLNAAIKRLAQLNAGKESKLTDPISDELRKRMRLVGQQAKTG